MTSEANWNHFRNEIAGQATSDFLRNRSATDLVGSLCQQHVAYTAASIRTSLAKVRNFDITSFVRSAPRIALSNCHLANYAGSELWTEEIARYLSDLGFPLIVYSPKLGPIARRIADRGITVTDDAQMLAAFEPNVVHVNHYAAVEPALQSLRGDPRIINMIHGLLPTPGLPARSGVHAYWSVALHATAKIQMLTECPWQDVRHIPNFFDENRFTLNASRRQKRALMFSSKTAPEQKASLAEILTSIGYELDHVGYGGVPSANPPELLGRYDLVFAVARSAIEALASGARVILWDSGAIGPLVTEDNFWNCVACNFSMASCVLPFRFVTDPEAADWVAEQAGLPIGVAANLAYKNLPLINVGPLLLEGYSEVLYGGAQGAPIA